MRALQRLIFPLILSIATLLACTKTARIVEPLDYDTALTDTTRMFEIHTRDKSVFISRKAIVQGDTMLVVMRGYQVQDDPWRQKKMASTPIHIPFNSVGHVSEIEIAQDRSLTVVLVTLAIVVAVAFAIGIGSGLAGP